MCCREDLPGRISCWSSMAPPTIAPATIREKIFKNYALKSIDAVHAKLNEAIAYINRRPELVKSITSFPYIARSF